MHATLFPGSVLLQVSKVLRLQWLESFERSRNGPILCSNGIESGAFNGEDGPIQRTLPGELLRINANRVRPSFVITPLIDAAYVDLTRIVSTGIDGGQMANPGVDDFTPLIKMVRSAPFIP